MLHFREGFFEGEELEGFYVDSTMKTVWAAEMEVLAAVADVCAKYQLPWYAAWGTLLGAVRHQGYIPWDDDIDICMLREDYEKLLQVLPQELPEGWIVKSPGLYKEWDEYWTCVQNADNITIHPKRLERFHGCPFIVAIDIFPLDYLPANKKDAETIKALINLIRNAVLLKKKEEPTKEDKKDFGDAVAALERFVGCKFDRQEPIISQLWQLANKLCATGKSQKSDILFFGATCESVCKYMFDKEWFDDVEYLPFESVEMPVPIGYDAVLTRMYGDYKKVVKGAASHDYPCYQKQMNMLRKIVQEMEASDEK